MTFHSQLVHVALADRVSLLGGQQLPVKQVLWMSPRFHTSTLPHLCTTCAQVPSDLHDAMQQADTRMQPSSSSSRAASAAPGAHPGTGSAASAAMAAAAAAAAPCLDLLSLGYRGLASLTPRVQDPPASCLAESWTLRGACLPSGDAASTSQVSGGVRNAESALQQGFWARAPWADVANTSPCLPQTDVYVGRGHGVAKCGGGESSLQSPAYASMEA